MNQRNEYLLRTTNCQLRTVTTLVVTLVYNLLFPLLFLLFLPAYLPRMLRRGGYRNCFWQRFGIFDKETVDRIGQGRLWVHAVSVGEVFIALKFMRHFRKRNPNARFLLSVTTTTALEIAEKETSDWLEPIANPLDFFFITNPLLSRFKLSALIMVEGDVWVQRLWRCKKLKIPTAIITARLSPRSERRFQKFSWIIAPLFNLFDFIGVPSLQDQERWQTLGIDSARLSITGNIKFDQEAAALILPPADKKEVFLSLGWNEADPILLAGSTYDLAEEEAVVVAWQQLRPRFPKLRLIIAPRHAERRHELGALFEKQKIKVALRSEKNFSEQFAEALLLDTTGELKPWYCLATVVFIGKSLGIGSARGGQNPVEPLALGRPVLVGPSMENFEPLISELLAAKGVLSVRNAEEIATATARLLLHPEEAAGLVRRGCAALQAHQGATERTCICVEGILKTSSNADSILG